MSKIKKAKADFLLQKELKQMSQSLDQSFQAMSDQVYAASDHQKISQQIHALNPPVPKPLKMFLGLPKKVFSLKYLKLPFAHLKIKALSEGPPPVGPYPNGSSSL